MKMLMIKRVKLNSKTSHCQLFSSKIKKQRNHKKKKHKHTLPELEVIYHQVLTPLLEVYNLTR